MTMFVPRQLQQAQIMLGGKILISARKVPHLVVRLGEVDYSIAWFAKSQRYRAFGPYPATHQKRWDLPNLDELNRWAEERRPSMYQIVPQAVYKARCNTVELRGNYYIVRYTILETAFAGREVSGSMKEVGHQNGAEPGRAYTIQVEHNSGVGPDGKPLTFAKAYPLAPIQEDADAAR